MKDLTLEDIELVIDKEIEAQMLGHNDQQLKELMEVIEKDGCFTDPIIYWEETKIILDGHQRNKIWGMLPEDTKVRPPRVLALSMPDKQAAIAWVSGHQITRRNLPPKLMSIARANYYDSIKSPRGGDHMPDKKANGKNCRLLNNSREKQQFPEKDAGKRAGSDTGVSERTIRNDVKFRDSVKALGKVDPTFEEKFLNGTIDAPRQDIKKAAELPREYQGKAISNLKLGKPWNNGIDTSFDKPKKPETPTEIAELERAYKFLGDVTSCIYAACNACDMLKRSTFEDQLAKLNSLIVRERKRMESAHKVMAGAE